MNISTREIIEGQETFDKDYPTISISDCEEAMTEFSQAVLKAVDDEVTDNIEYLQTTEGEEVPCVSLENLTGILKKYGLKE